MTTTAKLWLGFGSLTVLLVLTNSIILVRLSYVYSDMGSMAAVTRPRTSTARELEISTLGYALDVKTAVTSGDEKYVESSAAKAADVEKHFRTYEGFIETPRQVEISEGFRVRWAGFRAIADEQIRIGMRSADWGRFDESWSELSRFLNKELQADANASFESRREETVDRISAVGNYVWILLILGAVIAIATSVIVGRGVLQSEREIGHGRERLRATLASIGDAVITTDTDGRITFLNAVAENLTGWKRSEAEGKPIAKVFTVVFQKTRRKAKSPDPGTLSMPAMLGLPSQVKLVARSGFERAIENSVSPIRDEKEGIVGYVLIFRDVTDRNYEESRGALLAHLADLTRTINDPTSLLFAVSKAVGDSFHTKRCLFNEIDLDNDLEIVGRDYCRGVKSVAGTHKLSDYSPATTEEMKAGKTVVNRDSKTDTRTAFLYQKIYEPAKERSYVAVPLLRGGVWVASLWVSDDEVRDWSLADVRLLESVGERTWLAVEKLRSDAAFRESEERFGKAFNSSPLAIAISSLLTGKLVEVNETFVNITGFSRDEAIGKSGVDLRLWEHAEDSEAELTRLVEDGRIRNAEYRFRIKSGELVDGLLSAELMELAGEPCALTVIEDITDRKRNEAALRESEERRKLAQEAGNVGIWSWDIIAKKTYWSESMWGIYGETPSDIDPGEKYWSAHLHKIDRDRVRRHIKEAVESDSLRFHDEFRIHGKDGSIRWIESIARITRDDKGKAQRMFGVNLDITQRKESEERIRQSENQLRLVTNAVPALISYVDRHQRFLFVNQKFTEWFGLDREQLIGKRMSEVVGVKAFRELKPRIEEALAGNECTFETSLDFRNAGTRYVHVSFVPDVGSDGTILGFYGLTNDLTELKRSEELLRSSEERMGVMLETLTDYAIYSVDSQGRIESWNKGAEMIFGYSETEILGRSSDVLFVSEDVESGVHIKEMETALESGKATLDRWHIRKDGNRFFASGVLMPLYVGSTHTGFAKIASDLTEKERRALELKQAHDELEVRVTERTHELAATNRALVQEMEEREAAEKQRIDLLRRLVSSQEFERRRIARDLHDQLGQRLTALRLKIASLRDVSAGSPEIFERVERLQEIAERLDSEVSFLAWELRPTALDDLGLVDAMGAFVNEWSKHSEISAEFHSSKLVDQRLNKETETHLYRITQEALNNIAKHADPHHVTVLLEKRDDDVILIIEDDGKGFDTSEERVVGESSRGLGLIGMSERATLIGGNIEIESAKGSGTTIYVRVPISA